MDQVALSESAVATLRATLRGWKRRGRGIDVPAYRELVAAGIMEEDGDGFRLTEEGRMRAPGLVEREQARIERERLLPPDVSGLSGTAWDLLRRIASGERIEVTPGNLTEFRELAGARVVLVISTFAGGPESAWRWTYWGWRSKDEWADPSRARRAV